MQSADGMKWTLILTAFMSGGKKYIGCHFDCNVELVLYVMSNEATTFCSG